MYILGSKRRIDVSQSDFDVRQSYFHIYTLFFGGLSAEDSLTPKDVSRVLYQSIQQTIKSISFNSVLVLNQMPFCSI